MAAKEEVKEEQIEEDNYKISKKVSVGELMEMGLNNKIQKKKILTPIKNRQRR